MPHSPGADRRIFELPAVRHSSAFRVVFQPRASAGRRAGDAALRTRCSSFAPPQRAHHRWPVPAARAPAVPVVDRSTALAAHDNVTHHRRDVAVGALLEAPLACGQVLRHRRCMQRDPLGFHVGPGSRSETVDRTIGRRDFERGRCRGWYGSRLQAAPRSLAPELLRTKTEGERRSCHIHERLQRIQLLHCLLESVTSCLDEPLDVSICVNDVPGPYL